MPKLQIISDLHYEFFHPAVIYKDIEKIVSKQKSAEKADILVIAGDLCSCKQIVWILNEFAKHYEAIVYVNGNHELYGSHIDFVRQQRDGLGVEKLSENVHWLDNSTFQICGLEFVGCTLWFPNKRGLEGLTYGWSDFRHILNFREYVYKENAASKKFLQETVSRESIVVTHYLPTWQSVHHRYLAKPYAPYNGFFVCDMEDLIAVRKPKLWLSGHTHEYFDYWFNGVGPVDAEKGTRIVVNPKGYEGEIKDSVFDYWKIVEV